MNRRRHFFFGARLREAAEPLFRFWSAARQGRVRRIALRDGALEGASLTAPVAIYAAPPECSGEPALVLMQHGSYQIVACQDQPLLEEGEFLLYRGVGETTTFDLPGSGSLPTGPVWRQYLEVQAEVLSDSVRSFNSIHDRTRRCETGFLRDGTQMTDDIARRRGLDIDDGGPIGGLWEATHRSFSLARWVAEHKFGPHYAVLKTPLDNIFGARQN